MENLINLTIDNRPVRVPKGTTILDAAATVGIKIPALCHMDLKGTCVKNAPASCRICVVEVTGRRNLAPPVRQRSWRGWKSSPTRPASSAPARRSPN